MMEAKQKIIYWRTIFNHSRRESADEAKALHNISRLIDQVPNDDKEKIDLVLLVTDNLNDEVRVRELLDVLLQLAESDTDKARRLKAYRSIIINKHTISSTKPPILERMIEILEGFDPPDTKTLN